MPISPTPPLLPFSSSVRLFCLEAESHQLCLLTQLYVLNVLYNSNTFELIPMYSRGGDCSVLPRELLYADIIQLSMPCISLLETSTKLLKQKNGRYCTSETVAFNSDNGNKISDFYRVTVPSQPQKAPKTTDKMVSQANLGCAKQIKLSLAFPSTMK